MSHRPNEGTCWLGPDEVRSFLRSSGISDSRVINCVLDGFDFGSKPLYFRRFEPQEILFQFIREPSQERGGVYAGNWFCLNGATMDSVAIFGGGSGRRRYRYEVTQAFTTLEGVARKIEGHQWGWAGGGDGGGTQIYVPPKFIGHIASHGPDE